MHKKSRVFVICNPVVLLIVLVLMASPIAVSAEKEPGYEKYREGHEGYQSDGIIKEGENETAELARTARI